MTLTIRICLTFEKLFFARFLCPCLSILLLNGSIFGDQKTTLKCLWLNFNRKKRKTRSPASPSSHSIKIIITMMMPLEKTLYEFWVTEQFSFIFKRRKGMKLIICQPRSLLFWTTKETHWCENLSDFTRK
jgi:hypothetical protein